MIPSQHQQATGLHDNTIHFLHPYIFHNPTCVASGIQPRDDFDGRASHIDDCL